jgi:hypothetical protein
MGRDSHQASGVARASDNFKLYLLIGRISDAYHVRFVAGLVHIHPMTGMLS